MTRTSDRPTVEAFAAVLFDMDGTLVDSDAAVERAWRAWAREYGVDAEQVLAVMPGHPAADTVARMRPDLEPAAVEAAVGPSSSASTTTSTASSPRRAPST